MNRIKRYTAVLFILILTTGTLSAEVIQSIDIEGLKKTKDSTVKGIIGYREGDVIQTGSETDIKQKLVKSGLFVNETIDVQLESSGNDAFIKIYMNDRVSLLPIPIASFSDGEVKAGVFLMDSNFMGYGHSLFSGGMYGRKDKMFLFGYSNPTFRGSPLKLGVSMGVYDNEIEISNLEDDYNLAEYDQTMARFGINSGWDLNPIEISLGLDGSYISTSLSESDIIKFSQDITLDYSNLYYDKFFTEGIKSYIKYEFQSFSDVFDLTQSVQASFSWQSLVHERLQLELSGDSGFSAGDKLQSLFLQYGYSWTILPEDIMADRFIQGDIKLKVAALDFNWGYLAVPVTYQLGIMDGISGENEFYHGPSAGMAIYLKKVAIPAMAIRYAYNMENNTGVFTFNIGMSM